MEMEKTCEFCMLLKPVVYCEADGARLCLSCDAKVHSANALSNRHPRTLVCEPCEYNLAYIRCSDHQMFMCRDCDRVHHDLSSQHQRKVITSYMGCPSAKDLAALWGFGLNDLENTTPREQFIATSNGTVNGPKVTPKFVKRFHSSDLTGRGPVVSAESEEGSSANHTKALGLRKRHENTSSILQQILDLERLQLTEGSNNLTSGESQNKISSLKHGTSWNMKNKFDHLQQPLDLGPELQDWDSTHDNPVAESFPLPLPDGDSYWQCKSPVQSSQLWPQNLQDLGGYAELECFDNSNMPDVDLTFQNFEELFGEEQDLNTMLPNEEDMICPSVESGSSIDKSDYSYVKKAEDISKASSICRGKSSRIRQGLATSEEHIPTIKDCPPPIRTNFSLLSFSTSRLSSESSGNECVDSSAANEQEVSWHSYDSASSQLDSKENLLASHREKKKARLYEKQARSTPQRARTTLKKHPIKGRVLKVDRYETDAAIMSRSF